MDFCDQVVPTGKDNSRDGQKVRLWVLHDEEFPERVNSAYDVAHYLATSTVRASINACVDAEKVVGQVDWSRTAWHANHAATNACSIGVEHEGYAKQSRDEWLDPARGQATLHRSAKLFRDVGMGRYGIQPVRLTGQALIACVISGVGSGYCGHKDVTEAFKIYGGHTDPGDAFPYDVWVGWATETTTPPQGVDDMASARFVRIEGDAAVYVTDGAMITRRHIVQPPGKYAGWQADCERYIIDTDPNTHLVPPPPGAKTEMCGHQVVWVLGKDDVAWA